jgi:vitamin B12 transporter
MRDVRTAKAVTALLLVTIAAPFALCAQVSSDTVRLRDLVVTATRVPALASTIPQSTTVIEGADLRDRGVHFVLDALREVPGMTIVQTGSFGAVTSMFLRGGASDDVKVLLDGVPLNRPGGSIDLANLTTADLDRIEIVRGPASVLYGADAVSGVVQLFTRRASGREALDVDARGGTFGTSDVSMRGSLDRPNINLSATGSRFGTDGSYAFNDGYRNAAGSVRAAVANIAGTRAVVTARYGDSKAHFPTDGGGALFDHNQYSTERSLVSGIALSRSLGRHTSAALQGSAARIDQGYANRADSPADTVGFAFIDDRSGVTWRRGLDARIDWTPRRSTEVSVGAGLERETDVEHEIGVSNFGFGTSHDTTDFEARRTTRNGYVQVLATPANAISLQAGARIDDNSAFGEFGTWRVGAAWHVTRSGRIWAAAGTAFKAPTFSQLFAESAFEVGNPALTPEHSRNGELGAETTLGGGWLRIGVTSFWQRFRDLIQYISAAPGDPTYQNLGAASSRGVEAVVGLRASRNLTVSAQWTWLHTEVTDTGAISSVSFQLGSSLVRRPSTTGSATAIYRQRGLILAATVTRVGPRDDIDFSAGSSQRVILPEYVTTDLAVDVPIRHAVGRAPGFDMTARGENIFDAKYQQTVGFPGRGRTVFAGARIAF